MPDVEELYDQGLTLLGDGKHEEAVTALQQALVLDPDHVEAQRALAMTYYHMARYDEAVTAGKRLVELAPEDILARTSLSMAYMKKGMVPEAEHEGAQARLLGWKEQLKKGPGSSGTPIAPPPGA